MPLYAYCLSDVLTGRMLEDVAGVARAEPRLVRCGEISAVVSDFEGEAASITRENVFAHERVIERVLPYTTPLPFRFGTLLSAERLENYVAANRDALLKSLERVRDSVEMSVKIIWNAEEIKRRALESEQGCESMEDGPQALGEGAAYLAARRLEILGDKLLKERADEIAAWLSGHVGETAGDKDVRVSACESLVVRAAFLVRRERLQDYQRRVEKALDERAELRFLTSGPWPPYSFCHINP